MYDTCFADEIYDLVIHMHRKISSDFIDLSEYEALTIATKIATSAARIEQEPIGWGSFDTENLIESVKSVASRIEDLEVAIQRNA